MVKLVPNCTEHDHKYTPTNLVFNTVGAASSGSRIRPDECCRDVCAPSGLGKRCGSSSELTSPDGRCARGIKGRGGIPRLTDRVVRWLADTYALPRSPLVIPKLETKKGPEYFPVVRPLAPMLFEKPAHKRDVEQPLAS